MSFTARPPFRLPPLARALPRLLAGLALIVGTLVLSGCASLSSRRAPARTVVQPTDVPARVLANFFLVEVPKGDGTLRRYLIDTGSTATLVSADLAGEIGVRDRNVARRTVRVRSANGGEVSLEATTLRRLQLGATTFERVPALIYDFTELSLHLGVRIDGLIGFPVFRETLLTLDYPAGRLIIAPNQPAAAANAPLPAGASRIAFNNEQNTPFIPVQMGNESFVVLIDTGSDGGLNLNPVGLHPRFTFGPRPGTVVSSLSGDRHQLVGRLGQDVIIGNHVVENPIVDLTDQLSAIGGELLRNFRVTFDQRNNFVTFVRESESAVQMEPRRSTGLSFSRSPVYWRVMTVIPETPSTGFGVQAGDLVVRINGEPVAKWDFERYASLIVQAAKVTYTFLSGTREYEVEIPVFELVP